MPDSELTELLYSSAKEEGFPLVGAVDLDLAEPSFADHVARYDQWLAQGFAGTMDYLVRGRERRSDPRIVFPGTQSILCVGVPYDPRPLGGETPAQGPRYARYLRGGDYHKDLATRLERALSRASAKIPFGWKVCVDTSAVLERSWAALAGLGWIGKNTLLIHPKHGSYLFLGEALIDRKLGAAPAPLPDYCGHCTRCLEACPTTAIQPARSLDSNRCISYWTLEKKTNLLLEGQDRKLAGTWVAGCDICQEVCPFNRKAVRSADAGAEPEALRSDWKMLISETEEQYRERVRGSALKRVKPAQFARNLAVALLNAVTELGPGERMVLRAEIGEALRARRGRETDPALSEIWAEAMIELEGS